jgi:hypothetical protein
MAARRFTTVALTISIALGASPATQAQTSAVPPPVVKQQLASLNQIDRFVSLPTAIRAGKFSADGTSAAGWQMAEPGGAFSATDVPVAGAPGRRLIFAACDARLCIIHYERGGVAHFYEILALLLQRDGWAVVWNVRGSKRIESLDALRARLEDGTLGASWSAQWVKGDF